MVGKQHLVYSHKTIGLRLIVLQIQDQVSISVVNAYAPTSVAASEGSGRIWFPNANGERVINLVPVRRLFNGSSLLEKPSNRR